MFDFYSTSHILWNFLLVIIFKYIGLNNRTIILTLLICGIIFEVIENTDWGIKEYRKQELIDKGYTNYKGDTFNNIIGDIISNLIGILLAFNIKKPLHKMIFILLLIIYMIFIESTIITTCLQIFSTYIINFFFG